MQKFDTIHLSSSARLRLAEKLNSLSEPFGFEGDPALASLCTAVGIQSELGKKDFDRLSPFFTNESEEDFLKSDIIIQDGKIGLRLFRKDQKNLQVRHPDFAYLIDKDSFNEQEELAQILIFPMDIAETYRRRGFQLVIVPTWLKSSVLDEDAVKYFYANSWEVRNNIALTQVNLMLNQQLPFFGTHDIVDHLLGADINQYNILRMLYCESAPILNRVFQGEKRSSLSHLLVSYLIGVLLDDLAQPKWYASARHSQLVRTALAVTEGNSLKILQKDEVIIPNSFHRLMTAVRSEYFSQKCVDALFEEFLWEIAL